MNHQNLSGIAAELLSPSPHLAQFEDVDDMPACGRISTLKVAREMARERERLRRLALQLIRIRDESWTNP